VDARGGSRAARRLMGVAGQESATWDLKLTEAGTGEALLAVHHRSVSLTAMSDLHGKLVEWAGRFADDLAWNAAAKAGPGAGEPVRLPRHP
jgi:hypothetical protein